jgi:dihydroflavonol-4-reductase
VLNGAAVGAREALEILAELTGVYQSVRMAPPAGARGVATMPRAWPACAAGRARCAGREMGTILHGHRYDGSRATRELGLAYTPLAETFRRTIDWARE